jgi:hypothetical protein
MQRLYSVRTFEPDLILHVVKQVRKKTLRPKWQQPLLLAVRKERAVGELTQKGAKQGCYWFKPGNKLALQVMLFLCSGGWQRTHEIARE